jgi:hypothetical protein
VKCELSVEVEDLNMFLHSDNKTILASVYDHTTREFKEKCVIKERVVWTDIELG